MTIQGKLSNGLCVNRFNKYCIVSGAIYKTFRFLMGWSDLLFFKGHRLTNQKRSCLVLIQHHKTHCLPCLLSRNKWTAGEQKSPSSILWFFIIFYFYYIFPLWNTYPENFSSLFCGSSFFLFLPSHRF